MASIILYMIMMELSIEKATSYIHILAPNETQSYIKIGNVITNGRVLHDATTKG
jgi:hypothetical protein